MLREPDTTRSLINRIRKRQATLLFWQCADKRENRVSRDNWNDRDKKDSRGKQRKKFLGGLTKWLKIGRVTDALKVMRNRDAWKVLITYAKEHGTWLVDKDSTDIPATQDLE